MHSQEKCKALSELQRLVNSLLTDPPRNTECLIDSYESIKQLMAEIDPGCDKDSADTFFTHTRQLYPLASPEFLKETGPKAIVADSYRFFVQYLKSWILYF